MRSFPLALIGTLGIVYVVLGLSLFWRVITGPGDDNPVGLLGLLAAALALVPAHGIRLWWRGERLRHHLGWFCAAVLILGVLVWGTLPFIEFIWRGMQVLQELGM